MKKRKLAQLFMELLDDAGFNGAVDDMSADTFYKSLRWTGDGAEASYLAEIRKIAEGQS